MIRNSFNEEWVISGGNISMMDLFTMKEENIKKVNLPYDVMIHENRIKETKNGSQTGFYPGNIYSYIKKFDVPWDWKNRNVFFEFEGVSNLPKVYINGDYAGGCSNPYTGFYIPADSFLQYGQENEIKVVANNLEQTSRWYTGGGIYRNVKVIVGNFIHLKLDGLRITTPDVSEQYATVLVKSVLENFGTENKKVVVRAEISTTEGDILVWDEIPVTSYFGETLVSRQRMHLEHPQLWDDEHPNLYRCRITVRSEEEILDEEETTFGVRKLELSAQTGLLVNGREVNLRGSCIHHDNGILGASTFERAEERRCRQLKEAGFNSIRSSHHPISKAMLHACDKIGMYVMDELTDMWTRPKNPNDYSQYFLDNWEKDMAQMVDKDFNHPSVIFYSLGNEIQEAGTAKGAALNRMLNNKIKSLDDTRYTTNGVNGLLAGVGRMGEIMEQITGMSMKEMAEHAEPSQEKRKQESSEGANELNGMMGFMMGPVADAFATSPILEEMLEEFTSSMDVAGYNYLTALHEAEKDRHPNRIVLGTETFPADIVRLWDIVKNNHHVIGDMTWTGYDYLGEAGCGIFYYDGTQNFTSHWPDCLAYIGDIDITGYRKPISYLRECVYGLRKTPYIAVRRMNKNGQKSSLTPWMWKDNIASWTWPGYEGQVAEVDVYADADEVELLQNGKSLGRKQIRNVYTATFEVTYETGELLAIAYKSDEIQGKCLLCTAKPDVRLHVEMDRQILTANGTDMSFIDISLRDDNGNENLFVEMDIQAELKGPGELLGFGSADPQALGKYQDTTWAIYDGHLLAVIKSQKEEGIIYVTFKASQGEEKTVELHSVK